MLKGNAACADINILDYLRSEAAARNLELPLDLTEKLTVTEITDGNLNFAFCVSEELRPERALFVKQAPGYIKCLGEQYTLAATRALVESAALCEFQRLSPEHTPRHYWTDTTRFALVTQFLHGYQLLRATLAKETACAVTIATDIGTFMGTLHGATQLAGYSDDEAASLSDQFANVAMRDITAAYVFSKPLDAADETNRCAIGLASRAAEVRADSAVSEGVEALRLLFVGDSECIIHGDLHTGSVMVPTDGREGAAKVIDAEFAMCGSAAFDVGTFWAHVIFAAVGQREPSLLDMIGASWEAYLIGHCRAARTFAGGLTPAAAGGTLLSEARMRELCGRSAGFAGCELMRRVIGAAHVDDIEGIADDDDRLQVEAAALQLGSLLVRRRASLLDVAAVVECVRANLVSVCASN